MFHPDLFLPNSDAKKGDDPFAADGAYLSFSLVVFVICLANLV
jgi:hypothetical protein